jgi:hypothetical protein
MKRHLPLHKRAPLTVILVLLLARSETNNTTTTKQKEDPKPPFADPLLLGLREERKTSSPRHLNFASAVAKEEEKPIQLYTATPMHPLLSFLADPQALSSRGSAASLGFHPSWPSDGHFLLATGTPVSRVSPAEQNAQCEPYETRG